MGGLQNDGFLATAALAIFKIALWGHSAQTFRYVCAAIWGTPMVSYLGARSLGAVGTYFADPLAEYADGRRRRLLRYPDFGGKH